MFRNLRPAKDAQKTLMARLPYQDIVTFLNAIQNKDIAISAKAVGWEDSVIFTSKIKSKREEAKFANCVANLEPELKESIEDMGYSYTLDREHLDAILSKDAEIEFKYKTTYMDDDPNDPGACFWQFSTLKKENYEIAGVMIVAGEIQDDHPYNDATIFWLMGTDSRKRLNFTDGSFKAKRKEGSFVSSKDFEKSVSKGKRYEIRTFYMLLEIQVLRLVLW
jgi:hypothetical protein